MPKPFRCTGCGRAVPFYADEARELIYVEDDQGELVGVRCIDCQTPEERADVARMLREGRRRSA